jgi:stage II sporulation protein AA (anti-sigma F factor antagonist)
MLFYGSGDGMRTAIDGPVLAVYLSGELDHHYATEIRDKLDSVYERSECRHIVFDFSQVSFMDSSGIGMVMGRYKNAAKRGGKVALAGLSADAKRLYAMSGLQKIAAAYATVSEAGQAFEGGA